VPILETTALWTDKAVFAVLVAQLVLLIFAGGLAFAQWSAQVRPFIVVDFDERYPPFLQLVITNFGTTMARDVKFTFDPAIDTTLDTRDGTDRGRLPIKAITMFRDGISHVAPRKEFVVLFDDVRDMLKSSVPREYTVEVTYKGSPFGREYTDAFRLDVNLYLWRNQIRRKDVHDVAVELEKLRKAVGEEPPAGQSRPPPTA